MGKLLNFKFNLSLVIYSVISRKLNKYQLPILFMEQNEGIWVLSYVTNCHRLICDDVELTASNGNNTYGFAVRKLGQNFFVGAAYTLTNDNLILEGTVRDSSMNHGFR